MENISEYLARKAKREADKRYIQWSKDFWARKQAEAKQEEQM